MIESQIESCSAMRESLIEALHRGEWQPLPPAINPDISDIGRLIDSRKQNIAELEKDDLSERLQELELSLRSLKHRQILGEQLPRIEKYLEQKRWVNKANQSIGSTRNITAKYNELFQELVTDRYKDLFESILQRFKTKMNVTIDTYGQKGETLRQITLDARSYPRRYAVEQVLSDGEKMAVAAADFLTEATLDQGASGIILDDPVTSLDSKWKSILAECLVEYAQERQVIVFTHDLTFLYRITEQAKKIGVDVASHWIRDESGKPGYVYVGNSPVCEGDYKSAEVARNCYAKAKSAPPNDQQSWLQQGFGALRTSYEALVIFELFNGVVARFDERISFDRLGAVRIDAEAVSTIVERMAILSRYVDAHLHSDRFASTKPTPSDLLEQIEAFEKLRGKLKAAKKAESATATISAKSPDENKKSDSDSRPERRNIPRPN